MASRNKSAGKGVKTHEGAPAQAVGPEEQLRRALLTCMLWEDSFYESGVSIADRIAQLVPQIEPAKLHKVALEAREKQKLRHAPLWVAAGMCRTGGAHRLAVANVLADIVQRPDELTEFLSLYWGGETSRSRGKSKAPVAAQVKKGLGRAFQKFNAYQLAKYKQADKGIKLRDVMRLVRPKPKDAEQAALWKTFLEGKLEAPDTWEVALSAGEGAKTKEDKRARWQRLLAENKLGALALLRNLRNMNEAGVPENEITDALAKCKVDRVLPFRFITAARHAPQLEPSLEALMFKCVERLPKLPGKTALVVDHSGSMIGTKVSAKSELDRFDAAAALAMLAREVCEKVAVISFAAAPVLVAPRRGFALRDALANTPSGGTYLGRAVIAAAQAQPDRIIVITDEQSMDPVPAMLEGKNYMINVAAYQNGVGYGNGWTHVNGWSEAILDWISAVEQ